MKTGIIFLFFLINFNFSAGYEIVNLDVNGDSLKMDSSEEDSTSEPSRIWCYNPPTVLTDFPSGIWNSYLAETFFLIQFQNLNYVIYRNEKPSDVVTDFTRKNVDSLNNNRYKKDLWVSVTPNAQSCLLISAPQNNYQISMIYNKISISTVIMLLMGLFLYYFVNPNIILLRLAVKGLAMALIFTAGSYVLISVFICTILILKSVLFRRKKLSKFASKGFNKTNNGLSNGHKNHHHNGGVNLNPMTGIKLLTESEYRDSAREETSKALEQLRRFCLSPGSKNQMERIQSPRRFKEFLEGSDHVTVDEVIKYGNASFSEGENSLVLESSDEDDDNDDFDTQSVVNGDLILNGY